jgi:NTP pyrophosphatase (non-canonical NTP hydrolase)
MPNVWRNEWTCQAVQDILDERDRQDEKWGADRNLEPFLLIAVLGEEFGEAAEATLHAVFGGPKAAGLRQELVQVAAVALAMIEAYDRNDGIVHPREYWTKAIADLVAEHRGDPEFAAILQGPPRSGDALCGSCGHAPDLHANGCHFPGCTCTTYQPALLTDR